MNSGSCPSVERRLLPLAAALLTQLAAPAEGHILLTRPTPRIPNTDNIKYSARPCGGPRDPARVTTFAPGQEVLFQFTETINHRGYFSIELDETGDDSFTVPPEQLYQRYRDYFAGRNGVTLRDLPSTVIGPVDGDGVVTLLDHWGLHDSAPNNRQIMVTVRLPNRTCDPCTLRLTQVMAEDSRAYPSGAFYFHCADIKIASAADMSGGAGGKDGTGGAGGAVGSGGEGGAIGGVGGGGGATAGSGGGNLGDDSQGGDEKAGEGGTNDEPGSGGGSGPERNRSAGGCGLAAHGRGIAPVLVVTALLVFLSRVRRLQEHPRTPSRNGQPIVPGLQPKCIGYRCLVHGKGPAS